MSAIDDLRFTPGLLTRPAPRGMAVETTLLHFAIVAFTLGARALRPDQLPRRTHPLRGYFTRRDAHLGSYAIWHPRLEPREGVATVAHYPLLGTLGLLDEGETPRVHSVLLQPRIDFTIYLPPARVGASRGGDA